MPELLCKSYLRCTLKSGLDQQLCSGRTAFCERGWGKRTHDKTWVCTFPTPLAHAIPRSQQLYSQASHWAYRVQHWGYHVAGVQGDHPRRLIYQPGIFIKAEMSFCPKGQDQQKTAENKMTLCWINPLTCHNSVFSCHQEQPFKFYTSVMSLQLFSVRKKEQFLNLHTNGNRVVFPRTPA